MISIRGIIIGGTNSGCGKTTVVCAILQALVNRGLRTASFKCGPDYIDPMFHSRIIGASSYNLDGYFCDVDTLRGLFLTHGENAEISIIEGVMGFYDGEDASPDSLSKFLEVPAVVVVDCKGAQESIGAIVKGFLTYRTPNRIRGFIFNHLSEKLAERVRTMCRELGTEFLGFLPPLRECSLESRYLELVTADDNPELRRKMAILAENAEKFIDLERIYELSEFCRTKRGKSDRLAEISAISAKKKPVIAVARDNAFCFIYRDNIELLERVGCEVRFFSPIADEHIPEEASGLLLCGGYPELYARELSQNRTMLTDIREKIAGGMPVIAECGGFLYLHRWLETAPGEGFPLVGAIDADAFRTGRLQHFGYAELTANEDNLLCSRGESFRVHEFHYWGSAQSGDSFTARKLNGMAYQCVNTTATMYAGFPHLYFPANPVIAVNFARKCAEYALSPRHSQISITSGD